MSGQGALIITVVVLTALLAGFGATYVEQHARAMQPFGTYEMARANG